MIYMIKHDDSKRGSFTEYKYRIYMDGRLIAHYWHDYRGDDHGIEFVNDVKESYPVGRMTDFVEGGGPQPITLSDRAMTYLDQRHV